MSKDMYLMNQRFTSGVEDDEFHDYAQAGFEEILSSFVAADMQLYHSRMTDEPVPLRAIMQNATTDNPQFATLRQVLARMGTGLQCGNYIKNHEGWWLIPYLPGYNGIYEKAFLWYCNYMLRFISPLTGKEVCYPATTENGTRYNSGERDREKMRIGTSQYIVYIPHNEETILLDHGSRFILDFHPYNPTAFRVTQMDSTSFAYGGGDDPVRLLRMTLIEDEFNDRTDDAQNNIANARPYGNAAEADGSTMFG